MRWHGWAYVGSERVEAEGASAQDVFDALTAQIGGVVDRLYITRRRA